MSQSADAGNSAMSTPPEQARTDEVERVAIPVEFYQWLYKIERDVRVWDLTPNEISDLIAAMNTEAVKVERERTIEECAKLAEQWRDENKAAAAKARKSISDGAQNMAEMLDGAAIECNAIAAAIRNLPGEQS